MFNYWSKKQNYRLTKSKRKSYFTPRNRVVHLEYIRPETDGNIPGVVWEDERRRQRFAVAVTGKELGIMKFEF